MTPEDKEILALTVENAVERGVRTGVAPLWDKVNCQEINMALCEQRLTQAEDGQKAIITSLDTIRAEQYDGRVELKTEIVAQEAARVDARKAVSDAGKKFWENPIVVAVATAAVLGGLYAWFTLGGK
jgi:hypothetical protein